MQVLYPLLPELTVPKVLFSDRENYVFAMSHAPAGARVWKETLLTGEVDLEIGKHVGRVLGSIHQATAQNAALVKAFRDHAVFVQLRVEPYYRRIQERLPDVAVAVQPIIERMLSLKRRFATGITVRRIF